MRKKRPGETKVSIRVAQRIHDLDSGLEKGLQKSLLVCDSLPLKKKKIQDKKKKNSWKMYTGLNIAVEFSRCCSSISSKSFPEDRARDSDEDRLTAGLQIKCLSSDC